MRAAVLGGGRSSEHDVSLASAASVREGLGAGGHDVVDVLIARDGTWSCQGEPVRLDPGRGLLAADVVFPILHGPYGEDGTVQGLLECLGVPYVGAGVLASALCMDKLVFKDLMAQAHVPQVGYRRVLEREWKSDRDGVLGVLAELGLPVFVKPVRLGSSVGIAKVSSAGELPAAVEAALAHDPRVIVEAMSTGLEVECSVMGHSDPVASQPGEIVLTGGAEWYDYEAKYEAGGMELRIPPNIADGVRERVRELAVETFVRSGCSGLARVDTFIEGDRVLLNELNTLPGFTETSVFGKLFAASGVPYGELLTQLAGFALERHAAEQGHSY